MRTLRDPMPTLRDPMPTLRDPMPTLREPELTPREPGLTLLEPWVHPWDLGRTPPDPLHTLQHFACTAEKLRQSLPTSV
jgi:hypothetical protein